MVKQWLNEHNTGVTGTSLEISRLRQYRLNNLAKWHVAEIVSILPVLLQVALALFFAGLLVLLWTLHVTVATAASVLVGALALFTTITTILPTLRSDCSYLSLQAFGVFLVAQKMCYALHRLYHPLDKLVRKIAWARGDWHTITRQLMCHVERFVNFAFCYPGSTLTWRGREHHIIRNRRESLNAAMLMEGYSRTLSSSYLDDASICFTDLRAASFVQCFQCIYAMNKRHWGPNHSPLLHRLESNVCLVGSAHYRAHEERYRLA